MSVHDSLIEPLYEVRRFGAVGDGATLSTAAIQQAIDQCHADGGGVVLVPPGTYVTGTLYLKSAVTLHLTAGATLRGSADRADYNQDDVFPENEIFTFERTTGAHLIIAYQADNVAITGRGTIDGNSAAFFGPLPDDQVEHTYRSKSRNFPIPDWRPGQMVFFCRCQNVAVQDVALDNAPYWTLFLLGCRSVQVRGVRITNPPQTQNGDGIDIDCCRDVTVSDCIIHSGDDCITLRGNSTPLGDAAQPCERVAVTNCLLSSPCNAIRVGVGNGIVRDCTFDNLVIADSRTGINMVCRYSDRLQGGTMIENISFTNLTMDTIAPIHLIIGPGTAQPAGIHDIFFTNIRATGRQGCYFGGNAGECVTGIHMRDIDLLMTGGEIDPTFADRVPEPYSVNGYHRGMPCAVFGQHLDQVWISRLTVTWRDIHGPWKQGLRLEDASNVSLHEVTIPPPPAPITAE